MALCAKGGGVCVCIQAGISSLHFSANDMPRASAQTTHDGNTKDSATASDQLSQLRKSVDDYSNIHYWR